MRRDIDYRRYDPANFRRDHPDDPSVAASRVQAEALAARFQHVDPDATPLEQRREIEQTFDHLYDEQWDKNEVLNLPELQKQLHDYTNAKTDVIYEKAFDRIEQGRFPNDKWASWQGVKSEIDDARDNAPNDPEYLRQREQLEQYQAARSEAISQEINDVQQQFLKERGLDLVDVAGPEPSSPLPANKIEAPTLPTEGAVQEPTADSYTKREPDAISNSVEEPEAETNSVQEPEQTYATSSQFSAEQQSALAIWKQANSPEPVASENASKDPEVEPEQSCYRDMDIF